VNLQTSRTREHFLSLLYSCSFRMCLLMAEMLRLKGSFFSGFFIFVEMIKEVTTFSIISCSFYRFRRRDKLL
jgi:hypothetical protein